MVEEELGIPGGADLRREFERERPEEREWRERRVPRTLEIVSHEGADHLAMRRAIRTMLSTMQEGTERFSRYSVEYLREALDNRVWNLPEETARSPEDRRVAEEAEALKAEITARENLQGAFNNWNQFGGDVKELSRLFERTWLKVTPTAKDFKVIGNLSETPIKIEPIEVEPKPVVEFEVVEEERPDRKTGEIRKERIKRKKTRTREGVGELVGYRGVVKEGEERLGLKVDKALRAYVNIAVAKAPLWFLKEKVFKELSIDEVREKRAQARQALGISEAELKELSSLGADEPVEERIAKTREWVRNLVGDKDAERIAYELYYVMQLATKFGVRVRDRKPGETEEEWRRLDKEKFDTAGKPGWIIEGFPASDDLIKLAHLELRRQDEARKNRKAGPPSTLGCYPDLIVSFLDFVEIKKPTPEDPERKVSFWELWYNQEVPFGDLPWEELRKNIFDSYLYQRWRANNVLSALMKVTDWDLVKELYSAESLRGLHKDIQVACAMLGYPDKTQVQIKQNILAGAIISNTSPGWWKSAAGANPPEIDEQGQWEKALGDKYFLDAIAYAVTRSGFLTDEEYEYCIEHLVRRTRKGIKIKT